MFVSWVGRGSHTFNDKQSRSPPSISRASLQIHKAIQKYYFVSDRNPKLMGLSLYRPVHDELTEKFFTVDNNNVPFAFQQPCSWGAVWFPGPWRYFRNWMSAQTTDPRITEFRISSNSWYGNTN